MVFNIYLKTGTQKHRPSGFLHRIKRPRDFKSKQYLLDSKTG
jgi:hypothetical protein